MISETYRDVEIVLLEEENAWRFTANGRERKAPSIVKARESIDRALDDVKSKKVKAWEPFEAWHQDGYRGTNFRKVRVTSQAERARYDGTPEFWIVGTVTNYQGREETKREKVAAKTLYALNDYNAQQINASLEIDNQIDELEKKRGLILGSLNPIEVPV